MNDINIKDTTPIDVRGTAKIKFNATGEIREIKPEDLEWDVTGSSHERQMGPENIYVATVELESEKLDDELDADLDEDDLKISVTWEVSEYPLNCFNSCISKIEKGNGELIKDFDSIDFLPTDDNIDYLNEYNETY
ncbi:MAG: hypothetical protein GVY04_23750 [Cyanobacteria bacterium]|jgi:hypothetical protein|nr:hypothetical protein [Cyanobacteria bacterium GSL.Bin1]